MTSNDINSGRKRAKYDAQMTSIVVVKETNMIFGPITGYQSPQTPYIQPSPSIKCAPTRKRTQYRKQDFSPL